MKRLLVSVAIGTVTALAVSVMAFSMTTMFRPEWLSKAEPVVCAEGMNLELRNASPVPGELVLEATCVGEGIRQDVTSRLLLTAVGVIFVPVLLIATLAAWIKG